MLIVFFLMSFVFRGTVTENKTHFWGVSNAWNYILEQVRNFFAYMKWKIIWETKGFLKFCISLSTYYYIFVWLLSKFFLNCAIFKNTFFLHPIDELRWNQMLISAHVIFTRLNFILGSNKLWLTLITADYLLLPLMH